LSTRRIFARAAAASAAFALAAAPIAASAQHASQSQKKLFVVEETTVAKIEHAFKTGDLTCLQLVDAYLARIAAYENQGPAINALITVAGDVRAQAKAKDAEYKRSRGHVGPLHCIPVILKDNIGTDDMPTTGGSKALAGSIPVSDAHITKALRAQGAIILGKGNMDEWAHGGLAGYSSMGGQTLNPYDLTRSPAGSSGGPAAAVAANFAVLAFGSDTGGSIRGPVDAESLAGVKPTRGLVSGAGVIPFSSTFDVYGPMTRTVTDSALALNAIAGYDPADPRTKLGLGKVSKDYTKFLHKDALKGARIGVLRTYVTGDSVPVMDHAVETMRGLGATVVDNLILPADVLALRAQYYPIVSETEFKTLLGEYLQTYQPNAPVQTHAEVLAASSQPGFGMAPAVLTRLQNESTRGLMTDPDYLAAAKTGPELMREGVDKILAANHLDALVHATASGSDMASLSGYPDVMVQAGDDVNGVSVGMGFIGKAFTEAKLLGYAYAYEQKAEARDVPTLTPALPSE
jgi:amidase